MNLEVRTIAAPKLDALDGDSVMTFLDEWERYVRHLDFRDAQYVGDAQDVLMRQSVLECLTQDVRTIILDYELQIQEDQATNDVLLAYMRREVRSTASRGKRPPRP